MQLVSLILIRWIVIYPVDSAVQRLNKRCQIDIFCKFYSNIPYLVKGLCHINSVWKTIAFLTFCWQKPIKFSVSIHAFYCILGPAYKAFVFSACAQRGKNIKRQEDRIKFPFSASIRELCHESFQYLTNKNIRTANNISPSTGSCCKFSISLRVITG